MKYAASKEELDMIEIGKIEGSAGQWFVSYYSDKGDYYYLLTNGTMPRYDGDIHYHLVYHPSKEAATGAFEAFKKSREIKPKVKEEVKPKVLVKRLDQKDFMSALDEV